MAEPVNPTVQPKADHSVDLLTLGSRIRGQVIDMSHRGRTPHLGSALSCVDLLVAAYWGGLALEPGLGANRDRFILSKGHAATALYAVLAERGHFPEQWLETYAVAGSRLPEHPSRDCVPGVEVASGSLGHGLSLGVGMALAGRIQGKSYRIGVLMSDGECNEGSVWEAALFAAAQRLDHVVVLIDYNKWQATGRSNEVMALDPIGDKWTAFGWDAHEVDGHDPEALAALMRRPPDGSGRPMAIIAHTVKGKGVSFMEDDNNWHYRIPKAEEVAAAKRELGLA